MDDSEFERDFILVRNQVDDDQDDGGVSLGEWTDLVASDETLKVVPFTWGRDPRSGERLQVALQGGAVWLGHPTGMSLPIYWSNGQVVCNALDKAAIGKIEQLAILLKAQCIEVTK